MVQNYLPLTALVIEIAQTTYRILHFYRHIIAEVLQGIQFPMKMHINVWYHITTELLQIS